MVSLVRFVSEGDMFGLDTVACTVGQALYTSPNVGIPHDKGMHVKVLCLGEIELCS